MSPLRLLHGVFVGLIATLFALFTLTAVVTLGSPRAHRAAAQEAPSLTFSLTPSTTKARVGDYVAHRVLVENTGTTTIPSLGINLELPDALDARAVTCPGDNHGIVTFCDLGNFAPGSIADVLFIVQVGAKAPNGPVTASASGGATATVPPLKIVGPSRR